MVVEFEAARFLATTAIRGSESAALGVALADFAPQARRNVSPVRLLDRRASEARTSPEAVAFAAPARSIGRLGGLSIIGRVRLIVGVIACGRRPWCSCRPASAELALLELGDEQAHGAEMDFCE